MSLEDQILDIQEKLQNNEYSNEQSISQGIVLRLLSAMGWQVYDTQKVIPEYGVKGKRVDFALCAKKNKPVLFIEAKQPGNLRGADEQLFEYAYHEGIPFAVLTDGREWHFYLTSVGGTYEEKRIYKLDLIDRDEQESAHRLERYLAFAGVENGSALENAQLDYKNVMKRREAKANIPVAWGNLLDARDEMLIRVLSEKVESMCGYQPTQEQIITFLSSMKTDHGLIRTPVKPVGDNTYPRSQYSSKKAKASDRAKIKVTFPDGFEICQRIVADTFVDVIRKIGIERVRSLNMQMCGCPVISNQKLKSETYTWADAGNGIYIFTNSDTDKKLSQLHEMNDALSLGLSIEKV